MYNRLIISALFFMFLWGTAGRYGASAQSFYYPTDIIYSPVHDDYLVTNWANGNGNIVRVNETGIPVEIYYPGLKYPGGMCILGHILYFSHNKGLYGSLEPSYIVGIDLTTGQKVLEKLIEDDGIYMDLMTADSSGNLYFGDSGKGRIFKYNLASGQAAVLLSGLTNPYCVYYNPDDDRLIYTHSDFVTSYLRSVKTDGTDIQTEFTFNGYIEGVKMDSDGNYYFTSWGNDWQWGNESVYRINHSYANLITLSSGHNRPFGLCLSEDEGSLMVCNWGNHTLSVIDLSPFGTGEIYSSPGIISLFPNPCDNLFTIKTAVVENRLVVNIFDLSGRLVSSQESDVSGDEVSFRTDGMKNGLYIAEIVTGNSHTRLKLNILHP